jgi:hypothetical protein
VLHLRKADKATAKRQIATYKKEGFPRHYGLYENSILIRNHHDEPTRRLMEEWWVEYLKYSTRDQLSLPYLIWKLGYDKKNIHIIGHNLRNNHRFNRVHSHDRQ